MITEGEDPRLTTGSALRTQVLAAAEQAFARVMREVDEQRHRMPPELEPADVLRWAGDRVTELLADFAELPLDRLVGSSRSSRSMDDHGPATAPQPPQGEPLVAYGDRGGTAETRVWVHPIGPVPRIPLSFTLGELIGPDGTPWSATGAIFTPAELTLTGGPTSAVLRLAVPEDAQPGDHHGLVVGRGVPGTVVPITLVVR